MQSGTKTRLAVGITIGVVLIVVLVALIGKMSPERDPDRAKQTPVVINEAVRTLLYLPLYHAKQRGFFDDAGLDVSIVTGGTATNAYAAMLSGEAEFSVADPMYVPISREKGAETRVVAQVVARIALWGVTMDDTINDMSRDSLKGRRISTHPRPMTGYTYSVKTIKDAGLDPERDVEIIQSTPGTEIVPFMNGDAEFMLTIEPNVSKAVERGGRIVLSYPQILGDQIFTGLMTNEDYLQANRATVQGVVSAFQLAMNDIQQNRDAAVETAVKFFPQLDREVLTLAVNRIVDDGVLPKSVVVTESSWDKAIAVRVSAGDLKGPSSRSANCAVDVMTEARSLQP